MEYFKGDRIRLTGKAVKINGRNWLEFLFLEGSKAGQTGVLPSKEDAARNEKQRRREWQEQQDGFRRLREGQK